MKVLLLCGYFEPQYQEEISQKTKTWVENAANTFQQRLIRGLRVQDISLKIVSAPFIGPWPTAYQDVLFTGFKAGDSAQGIRYVHFNNLWGYRNLSRTAALKRCVKEFVREKTTEEKAILVYCPHTPFLEAAIYGKALDPSIHIHMVVPDLPQYMNLSKKAHPIYDFFKKIDIRQMEKLIAQVDSFTLLTEYMADKMQVGRRPYIVVEGITDRAAICYDGQKPTGKKIAYAGKLVEAFGVKRLIEAFDLLSDGEATLHICGGGELKSYVEQASKVDRRIHYHGVVTAEKANEILCDADVLVNPRQNDDEYTKYSFPSKNIEYLMTGHGVVAYVLDGMPSGYRRMLYVPKDNTVKGLALAIEDALQGTELPTKRREAEDYIRSHLYCASVGEKIVRLMQKTDRTNEKR